MNFLGQLNSFFQPNRHTDNAPGSLSLSGTSISGWKRATAGGGLGSTIPSPVQFAPAADITLPGHEEIDGPLKFMGPVFPR